MAKKPIYSGLDPVLDAEAGRVWRLCLLMVRDGKAAEELCFQSFLRLAARREKEKRDDRALLYASACRLCEDWFGRKLRRPAGEKALLETFSCGREDALYALVRQPLSVRAAAGLALAGFTAREMREIYGGSARNASRVSADALARAAALQPPDDFAARLGDRILDRFGERSVGFENALQEIRIRFGRAAPWLALLVLLFFAFCVWYVQNR